MLTDQEIEQARIELKCSQTMLENASNDRVRIAYEWLDAQIKTKRMSGYTSDLKHMIEAWAGRYISKDDVIIAAYLHKEIISGKPDFNPRHNISLKRVLPSFSRLHGIREAFKHSGYKLRVEDYGYFEGDIR